MLNHFVCVKWGTLYGPEYVNTLFDMVMRNVTKPFDFTCFTEAPSGLHPDIKTRELPDNLRGWWNKAYLFRPGLLEGRVIYLDLDVCIIGSLDELTKTKGIIQDWNLPTYNSSVMVWDAGEHPQIWTDLTPAVMEQHHGDQDWITACSTWPTFPEGWCTSFKANPDHPTGKVVCFHGQPKPHQLLATWVERIWKIGGLAHAQFVSQANTERRKLRRHIKLNRQRGQQIGWQPPNNRTLVIIGGGPSINSELTPEVLENFKNYRVDVWSLNNTLKWLLEREFVPDGYVLLDARKHNAQFVIPHPSVTYYIASQCHPTIFNRLQDCDVRVWHARAGIGEEKLVPSCISGGGTVGLRSLYLAHVLGYRDLHLYGYDSCYFGNAHHAYSQAANDADKPQEVWAGERRFMAAPWMIRQAEDFQIQVRQLLQLGTQVTVHGDGLIPHVARLMSE